MEVVVSEHANSFNENRRYDEMKAVLVDEVEEDVEDNDGGG